MASKRKLWKHFIQMNQTASSALNLTTETPLTCVLQARWGVGRWREAVGSSLEGRRCLMADALGPLPALDSQAASAGLVAVHPAGCRRSVHLVGERGWRGEVAGEEEMA